MQLVIDIHESIYEVIKETPQMINRHLDKTTMLVHLMEVINQGTPLPEGHGDLIDRNYLLDCSYEIDSRYCEYDEVVNVTDIKAASTIIAADKEPDDEADN